MKSALILCTYNRIAYLKKCFESLSNLDEIPNYAIIVDDHSDAATLKELRRFKGVEWATVVFKNKREGIKDSLLKGFDIAFGMGVDIAINLDSDAIVKPNFITRLKGLKARFPDRIISGFNCDNKRNPVLFDGADYVERRHCNGINMCIDKLQYENIIRPALLRPVGNWDFDSTNKNNFIITKPSVCEHIGIVSAMGHGDNPDVSCDF